MRGGIKLAELLKIRAFQIKGWAYCLNIHRVDTLKLGETSQRILFKVSSGKRAL
ncbi:MAG: hypothetical protein GX079_03725 [Tissierellia bacterium]|nr:hypothetical protein [Tissierellia bacterium]